MPKRSLVGEFQNRSDQSELAVATFDLYKELTKEMQGFKIHAEAYEDPEGAPNRTHRYYVAIMVEAEANAVIVEIESRFTEAVKEHNGKMAGMMPGGLSH